MKTPLATLLLLTLPSILPAQGDIDCAAPAHEAEAAICDDPALQELTARVRARYEAALDVTRALGVGAAEAEAELERTQAGWIGGRNECWKEEDVRACIEATSLRRENDLVARYLLEVPTTITTWSCEGTAEIYAYFFDTPLPSVRLEYGDRVDTGSLTPTGSGARYEASFGTYLWVKGDAATASMELGGQGPVFDCTLTDERQGF